MKFEINLKPFVLSRHHAIKRDTVLCVALPVPRYADGFAIPTIDDCRLVTIPPRLDIKGDLLAERGGA